MNAAPFRCDVCGRFVAARDIADGRAVRRLLTPDSQFTPENYETLCRKCRIVRTEIIALCKDCRADAQADDGTCEDCGEPAVGFNDNGRALCEDCLVEWTNAEIAALGAIGAYD